MFPFAVVVLLGFLILVIGVMTAMYFQHTAEGKRSRMLSGLRDKIAERDLIDLEEAAMAADEDIKEARSLLNK